MAELVARNVVDRAFADIAGAAPWSVHAEWLVPERLDMERLGAAAVAVVARHPLLRARAVAGGDAWEIGDHVPRPEVALDDPPDDAAVGRLRDRVVSRPFDLEADAPVRFHLLRSDRGDHVLAVADHALVDGVAIGRVVASWLAAYRARGSERQGRAEPVAVDRWWRVAQALAAAAPPAARVEATVAALRRRGAARTVRLAREQTGGPAGYGVAYHRLPSDDVARLRSLAGGGVTVNDVVVAAFALAVMAWNRDLGVPAVPCSLGVPLNLRPARGWLQGVCNATLPWPVHLADDDPATVLAEVAAQLRPVRAGLYSPDVRALLAYLAGRRRLPVWLRHGLATTTVVSTVPGAEALRADGVGLADPAGLYGGAPAPATMGMTFAVMPDRPAYRLSARYLRSHHSRAGAARFLGSVTEAIRRLSRGSSVPRVEVGVGHER